MDDAPSWHPVLIPAGPIDGAVVELQVRPDGLVTAERRTPAARHRLTMADSQTRAEVAAEVSAELVRTVLEAVCERDGISLESSVEPGKPARNYELAVRLKIGKVFGLREEDTTMGEWNITIAGHGIHDNGRDDDADAIPARFVEELRKSQEVKSAVFTVGAAREIGIPAVQP